MAGEPVNRRLQAITLVHVPASRTRDRGWAGARPRRLQRIGLDPRSETLPGAILYRFEGPLLFFNAEYFKSRVRTLCGEVTPRPRWFVLSVESVTQLDTSGIQALDEIYSELKAEGIRLLVARPKLYMRRYGESTGIGLRVGRENAFPSVRAAVEAMLAREGLTDRIPAEEVPDGPSARFSITSGPVSNRRTGTSG